MGEFFKLVADVGFPIASALAAGYFVFLTLKFILAGVTGSVEGTVIGVAKDVKTTYHYTTCIFTKIQ